jgi:formylglycine-generating enzyme required for sulfatase activity
VRPWIAAAGLAVVVAAIALAIALPGRPPASTAGVVAAASERVAPGADDDGADAIAPAERTFAFEHATVARDGSIARETRQARSYQEDLGKGVAIEMVAIPGGRFAMGDSSAEYPDEAPQHEVTIAPFYLSRYEVTQAEWRAVATGLSRVSRPLDPDPSAFKGDDLPVDQVSWEDAMEFCERVSRKTHHAYHLPSEAEWEYAARAGTTTAFAFGPALTPALANFDASVPFGGGPRGSAPTQTVAVGSFGVANAFGLADMHGNVAEWCLGEYHPSYDGAPSDGRPWISNGDTDRHVLRGGSWGDLAVDCRSSNRYSYLRDGRQRTIGFRLAMSLPAPAGTSKVASVPPTRAVGSTSTGGGDPAPARAADLDAKAIDEVGTAVGPRADVAVAPSAPADASGPRDPRVDGRPPRWTERPAAARVLRRRGIGLPPSPAR